MSTQKLTKAALRFVITQGSLFGAGYPTRWNCGYLPSLFTLHPGSGTGLRGECDSDSAEQIGIHMLLLLLRTSASMEKPTSPFNFLSL